MAERTRERDRSVALGDGSREADRPPVSAYVIEYERLRTKAIADGYSDVTCHDPLCQRRFAERVHFVGCDIPTCQMRWRRGNPPGEEPVVG